MDRTTTDGGTGSDVLRVLRMLGDVLDRRNRLALAGAIGASTLLALLDMAAVALVLPLVDLAAGGDGQSGIMRFVRGALGDPEPRTLLTILAVSVVGLFVLKDLGSVVYAWWLAGFKVFERVRLQTRMLDHFLHVPYTAVSRRSSAELIRVINDAVGQVFGTAVFGLMGVVNSVIAILAIVAALVVVAPLPTVAVIAYFGVASVAYFILIKPRAAQAGSASAQAVQEAWAAAFAALGGIKELKVRHTQHVFVERFRQASERAARAARTAEVVGALPRYLLEILFILAVGVVLVLGRQDVADGSTIGVLSLFVAAGFRVLPSITGLLANLANFRFGVPYLELLHREVLAQRTVGPVDEGEVVDLPFARSVEVEDVSFRFPDGERDVLTSVSLSVARGTSVALVGGSGAGKTTLADILLGLHDPTHGRVLVDGVDIARSKRGWQRKLGYVAQDIFFLDGTLAENVAFDVSAPDIDRELLSSCIRQAQLEDLVAQLPQGVDTQVGEHGARLSGGQRQRVGIARALYRRPAFLVLDEATAALDNETEHRFTEAVAALHGEVTVLLIAHRLSTVRHCDRIIFMKDGRIEASGSFDEVREASPDFERLVRLGTLESSRGPA